MGIFLVFKLARGKDGGLPTLIVAGRVLVAGAHGRVADRLVVYVLAFHHGSVHALSAHLSHRRVHVVARVVIVIVVVVDGIAVHATSIQWAVVDGLVTGLCVIGCIVVHAMVEPGAYRAHVGRTIELHVGWAIKLRAVNFFAHAIDFRPEALLQPTDLTEYLVAAHHLLFAVTGSGGIRKLIDERARGIYKFVERWRCPVWNQGLMKSHNMVIAARRRHGRAERGGVLPGGTITLRCQNKISSGNGWRTYMLHTPKNDHALQKGCARAAGA